MSYSNEGIPDSLFEMLQNSEIFEVWFLNSELRKNKFEFNSEYLEFQANQVTRNLSNESKKNLISAFNIDSKKGGEPSRCWIPHHGIRAVYNSQLIEIAICFSCNWFRGEISEERFYGTLPDEEESETRKFLNGISLNDEY